MSPFRQDGDVRLACQLELRPQWDVPDRAPRMDHVCREMVRKYPRTTPSATSREQLLEYAKGLRRVLVFISVEPEGYEQNTIVRSTTCQKLHSGAHSLGPIDKQRLVTERKVSGGLRDVTQFEGGKMDVIEYA
jgi:hypothetical protein